MTRRYVPIIKSVLLCLSLLTAGLFFASSTQAISVPYQMNFQGRLNDSTGKPMPNGSYNMQFRIYSASSGGSALWSEVRANSSSTGVTITTGGLFSVQLGSVTALPPAIFNSATPLYLEVELPTPATATGTSPSYTEGAMSPRNPIVSSPFAINSHMLNGNDASFYQNATNINAGTLSNGRLTGSGALSVVAGTGLQGGGSVALGSSTTISIDTAYLGANYQAKGTYVSGSGTTNQVGVFNASGVLQGSSNFQFLAGSYATLTLGSSSLAGSLTLSSGGIYTASIRTSTGLTNNTAFVLPVTSLSIAEICTSAGNCIPNGTAKGDMLYWDGTKWTLLALGSYGQSLTACTQEVRWGGCVPSVTTTAVSSITDVSASSGGNVTSDGGQPVTARGVAYGTSPNPTIAGTRTSDGSGTGSFTSSLSGLTANTTYYVRAYATNSVGTAYGNQISFTTAAAPACSSYSIGATGPGGGIVFYKAGSVCYEAAPSGWYGGADPTTSWGCSGTTVGSSSQAIGSGLANTNSIISGCSTSGIAARLARNYTGGGKSDWFLPSLNELIEMYNQRTTIGGIAANYYWSSSESTSTTAWFKHMSSGNQYADAKTINYAVRPIRTF